MGAEECLHTTHPGLHWGACSLAGSVRHGHMPQAPLPHSPPAPACPCARLLSVLLCPTRQLPNKGSGALLAHEGARLWAEVPGEGRQHKRRVLGVVGAQGSRVVAPQGGGLVRLCHPCAMQLAGRWFLVGMASRCSYLAEHSHQLEATAVTVTVPDGQSLVISTFRKL